jgi:DNA polymerase III subunit delta
LASVAAEELKPVYLITGSDRPKIERALRRLRDRIGEDAVERLDAHEATGEDIVAACNAIGLFGGGGRLVLVEGVERWKAADGKAVVAYLDSPTPETVLVLVGEGLKIDSALGKACKKAGTVLAFDVVKKRLPDWVAGQFQLLGANAEAEACRALVELVGEDPYELAGEVQKLAAWAGGEPIGAKEVQLLAAGRAETTIFQLTDAWGRRDPGAALAACEARLEQGDDPTRLVGLLVSHVSRVAECRAAAAEGLSSREVAGRMKKSPFYVHKLFEQAENFSVDELRDAVVRLAELDLALKGNSRLPGDLELERALVDITRRPEPASAAARAS